MQKDAAIQCLLPFKQREKIKQLYTWKAYTSNINQSVRSKKRGAKAEFKSKRLRFEIWKNNKEIFSHKDVKVHIEKKLRGEIPIDEFSPQDQNETDDTNLPPGVKEKKFELAKISRELNKELAKTRENADNLKKRELNKKRRKAIEEMDYEWKKYGSKDTNSEYLEEKEGTEQKGTITNDQVGSANNTDDVKNDPLLLKELDAIISKIKILDTKVTQKIDLGSNDIWDRRRQRILRKKKTLLQNIKKIHVKEKEENDTQLQTPIILDYNKLKWNCKTKETLVKIIKNVQEDLHLLETDIVSAYFHYVLETEEDIKNLKFITSKYYSYTFGGGNLYSKNKILKAFLQDMKYLLEHNLYPSTDEEESKLRDCYLSDQKPNGTTENPEKRNIGYILASYGCSPKSVCILLGLDDVIQEKEVMQLFGSLSTKFEEVAIMYSSISKQICQRKEDQENHEDKNSDTEGKKELLKLIGQRNEMGKQLQRMYIKQTIETLEDPLESIKSSNGNANLRLQDHINNQSRMNFAYQHTSRSSLAWWSQNLDKELGQLEKFDANQQDVESVIKQLTHIKDLINETVCQQREAGKRVRRGDSDQRFRAILGGINKKCHQLRQKLKQIYMIIDDSPEHIKLEYRIREEEISKQLEDKIKAEEISSQTKTTTSNPGFHKMESDIDPPIISSVRTEKMKIKVGSESQKHINNLNNKVLFNNHVSNKELISLDKFLAYLNDEMKQLEELDVTNQDVESLTKKLTCIKDLINKSIGQEKAAREKIRRGNP